MRHSPESYFTFGRWLRGYDGEIVVLSDFVVTALLPYCIVVGLSPEGLKSQYQYLGIQDDFTIQSHIGLSRTSSNASLTR